jgi:protein-export membrane protein SecD
MSSHFRWFIFILLLSAFALWVNLPGARNVHIDGDGDNRVDEEEFAFQIKEQPLGLDLVGGLRVLLRGQSPQREDYTSEDFAADLRETANNVARRVNAFGLTESTVQVVGNDRILVEIPGEFDVDHALETIRETALLEFVNFSGLTFAQVNQLEGQRICTNIRLEIQGTCDPTNTQGETIITARHPNTGQPFNTIMTGAGLRAAQALVDPNTREWMVEFSLTDEGSSVFGPFTGANIGQPLAIVLDGVVVSAPTIQSALPTGGVISGGFRDDPNTARDEGQQEARTLALQLRSGSLRIPLEVENAVTVGATLGQESVSLSVRAGIIGVSIVLTFMLIYYRVPGLAAAMALLVFILLNLMLFKLIPITLTLPAITGFLISIGTAVDGNILIFERMKEELRSGKPLQQALDAGFDRAWTSIRDSNFSTIIICGILFFFGQTPGASIVSGFAVTLALGLVVNLFTAVVVTRTFLYLLVGVMEQPLVTRKWLLGV